MNLSVCQGKGQGTLGDVQAAAIWLQYHLIPPLLVANLFHGKTENLFRPRVETDNFSIHIGEHQPHWHILNYCGEPPPFVIECLSSCLQRGDVLSHSIESNRCV